jgi:predicted permease
MNWKELFGVRPGDREIREEIEAHLRMDARDRVERGASPEEACSAASREFGNLAMVQETIREVWVWRALEQLLEDLHFAARILTKSPGFCAAAVVLISLGIGGNAAIYSMVNGVFHKPMPGVHAKHLISLGMMKDGHPDDPGNSYPNYVDYVAQTRTLQPLLARGWSRFTLTLDKASYGLFGTLVTANYFATLNMRLEKGRPFTAEESRLDASSLVAVISHSLWQEVFGGAGDIAGRRVVLNGHPATIIGVAPPRFRGLEVGEQNDIWVPLLSYARIYGMERDLNERAIDRGIGVELIGRLAPGASLSEARAEFATISQRLQMAYPEANRGRSVRLEPYSAIGPGIQHVRMFLNILMVVAILALLVICANGANLMLSRAVFRQREIAVRKSLGASRQRIFRMLLAEGLLLCFAAWVAAWLFANWASQAILRLISQDAGRSLDLDFTPDWRVAAYALALAAFSMLAFTMAPTIRAWRQDPLPWLKAGQHGVAQGRSGFSAALVVIQVALCVVLITSAALAYRSQYLIDNLDLHYEKDHLVLAVVNTAGATGREQNVELLERLRKRLRAVPGVWAVSYARVAPLRGGLPVGPVTADASREAVPADGNYVGPEYFQALGVVPWEGRGISELDRRGSQRVAVINRNLAAALWPGHSAIGQTILMGAGKEAAEVVGVVPNAAFADLRQSARPNFLFLAERQTPADPGEITFHVRYVGTLETIAPAIRAAIREADSRVPVFDLRSMNAQIRNYTGPVLMIAILLSLFAIGALILAAIGLYAVITFNMSRRTRDFAIRVALGASSRQIIGSVLKEGMLMTAIGLGIGFALSMAGAKTFGGLLFGVTPTDPPTYLGVFALLTMVSLIASYLPARRAGADGSHAGIAARVAGRPCRIPYSCRRASIGSTRVARRKMESMIDLVSPFVFVRAACRASYGNTRNGVLLDKVASGVTTWINPEVAPGGTVVEIADPSELTVKDATGVPLKRTLVALVRSVPRTRTALPVLPAAGSGSTNAAKPSERLKTTPHPPLPQRDEVSPPNRVAP